MNGKKLLVGRIPYANVYPIFYILDNEVDCSQYTFVEGVPSRLNRMLREGEVDISPSSSIEYLENPGRYSIISNHSISSKGRVGSILLFTSRPLEELDKCLVLASSQSATSVALLKIVLRKFYRLCATVEVVPKPEQTGDAEAGFLLIGDDALKYSAEVRKAGSAEAKGKKHLLTPFTSGLPNFRSSALVYDLGEIWYRQTGLPFVFALWIMRNNIPDKQDLVEKFTADLDRAKEIALERLPRIAQHAPIGSFLSEEEILSYWNKLDYELSDEHKKGLALFDQYRKEISH